MEENKYLELITKHLTGSISDDEKKLFYEWLDKDKKNMDLFKELKKLWELSGKYESDFEPDVNSAIDRFKTRIASNPSKKTISLNRVLQIASVFILLTLAAFTVYYFSENKVDVSTTKLTASSISKAEFILPDSSKVWLNKNSELTYSGNFVDRIVNLTGEAYFEVKKANGKSFTIISGNTKTIVLGTSFIVKNLKESKDVEVIVVTGKVALSGLSGNANHKVVLNTGEQGIFNAKNSTISVSKFEDPNILAWKTNVLIFRNTPIDNVLKTLEEFYNKKLIIEEGNIEDCVLTSTFDHQNLNDVLEELRILWNIEYIQKGDVYVISKGGC